jgi:hypothetical protein
VEASAHDRASSVDWLTTSIARLGSPTCGRHVLPADVALFESLSFNSHPAMSISAAEKKYNVFALRSGDRRRRRALRRLACERLEDRAMLEVSPSVGGFAWHDLDRDGFHDASDPPVAGVHVALYDAGGNNEAGDGDDILIGETDTGPDGHYAFVNVPTLRTYTYYFTPPEGFYVGHTADGSSTDLDSAVSPVYWKIVDFLRTSRVVNDFGIALETPPEFASIINLRSTDSAGYNAASALARDRDGNLYVAGVLQGSVDFDPSLAAVVRDSGGRRQAFVASYAATGELRWAQSFGAASGNGTIQADALAVSNSGDIYVAGPFSGTVAFDPSGAGELATASGESDIFVSKFDADGNFVWSRVAGGIGVDELSGLTIDLNGNVIAGGAFSATVDFNPSPTQAMNVTSAGGRDAFVWKLSPAGDFASVSAFRGSGDEIVNSVIATPDGGIVSAGVFNSLTDFNPGAAIFGIANAGSTDIFVAKVNAAGSFVFAKTIGTVAGETAEDITADAEGNLYVTGKFYGLTDFNPGAGIYPLASGGDSSLGQVYALKLDAAGSFVWAKAMTGRWDMKGIAISVDAAQNVSVGGTYYPYGEDIDADPGPANFAFARRPASAAIPRSIGDCLRPAISPGRGSWEPICAIC